MSLQAEALSGSGVDELALRVCLPPVSHRVHLGGTAAEDRVCEGDWLRWRCVVSLTDRALSRSGD